MKSRKLLFITLLFWLLSGYATPMFPVDAKHPFLKIGTSNDKSSSSYIGAYGNIIPVKTDKGTVILMAMMVEDIANASFPKGAMYEYIITADCNLQIAKILLFWRKSDENSPGQLRFNLTGDALNNKIIEELDKQPLVNIVPGSFAAITVSSACHYLGIDIIRSKYKPREWTAML